MSSLRNFGIAFLIALVAFAAIAYYSVGVMASLFDPQNKTEISGAKREVKHLDGEVGGDISTALKSGRSFTVLIVGTDHDPQVYSYEGGAAGTLTVPRRVRATTVFLARFDKEQRAFEFCLVPSSTLVEVDYVKMELGQAYAYKGAEFIRDQVSGLTGLAVDYLFEFSGRQFIKNAPRTPYVVPLSLDVPDYKGLNGASFVEGSSFGGEMLYTYLHYDAFPIVRYHERIKIVEDLFIQTLVKFAGDDPDAYYAKIAPLHTDMTKEDVAELLEVLTALPLFVGSSEKSTTVIDLEIYKCGTYDASGGFTLDRTMVDALFKPYAND
ncbi:MAG: hypothetical protein IJU52_01055 [Clostridia bacterium]|nr:hypothetical protein [Clostridia bacterium]